MKQFKNPHSRKMISTERSYFASNDSEMTGAYNEAQLVEHMASLECGVCGSEAWFHSGIGAYRCPNRHLRFFRSGETAPRWA